MIMEKRGSGRLDPHGNKNRSPSFRSALFMEEETYPIPAAVVPTAIVPATVVPAAAIVPATIIPPAAIIATAGRC